MNLYFCLLVRCLSPNFPLDCLVINWDVFVLFNVRSKNQSPQCVSAAAVCMLFSLLLCVWVPRARSGVPFSCRALPGFLWRAVMFLDQGLLQIGVFFLVGLEWSKTTRLHFAQSLQILPHPSIAESSTLKPQEARSTCDPRVWLPKAGNSRDVVCKVHPQSDWEVLLCLLFLLRWSTRLLQREGGRGRSWTGAESWPTSQGKEERHASGRILAFI